MDKVKSQEKQILEELGSLLYFAYGGTNGTITMPSDKGFVDVLEGLRNLNVVIRYMKFDIEATKRENESLRNLLKGK